MAERAQIVISGIVQGVGFRPHVFKLASELGLHGYVTNTAAGVLIEVEGARAEEFIARVKSEAPPLSSITGIVVKKLPLVGYPDFSIQSSIDSADQRPFTLVSPDTSICSDCLKELLDPHDRRYLYPFINCTNCGPRYSITKSVPYDRPNTTMAGFTLCPECEKEYRDPRNRRFHAQPNACPVCGPQVEFVTTPHHSPIRQAQGRPLPQGEREHGGRHHEKGTMKGTLPLPSGERTEVRGTHAIQECIRMLKQGGIVAIKGLGGFHLACDAANDAAVRMLRERKRKSNKPFAVMAAELSQIERFCIVSEAEKMILASNRRPIVLLRKNAEHILSEAVSPNNVELGCMLPYTPLHYLLFAQPVPDEQRSNAPHFVALVMTSGNLSEEPIVRDNDEALEKLSSIADGFLIHDRDIFMRVDDSVVRVGSLEFVVRSQKESEPKSNHSQFRTTDSELFFIRRSRGYAPDPIELAADGPEVMGCGSDLKNTFTLTKGNFAIPSQHIGDVENYETLRFYEECLANLKAVYRAEPKAFAHDLHPGYLSTRWAQETGARDNLQLFGIQHHHAHIGSVMAEHGITSKVIGVAFDGTGYGTDGNLWGSEFLTADCQGFERFGYFNYAALPGGEAAIREPWRTAVSYVFATGKEFASRLLDDIGFNTKYGKSATEQIMRVAAAREFSPLSSGAGRLFDAVAAMIGVCDTNTFEGEAAMALEAIAKPGVEGQYIIELKQENGYTVVDFSGTINGIVRDVARKIDKGEISAKFHNTIVTAVRAMVRRMAEQTGIALVALSGGTFQNQYLRRRTVEQLKEDGLTVLLNQRVPCNDGGISLGQAYIVRERLKRK
jgi:hydrogenase maturation protein HypF